MCTSHQSYHRNPLHCLLPPHMLEEIAKNADEDLRRLALHNLSTSGRFRGTREVLGEMLGLFQSAGDQKRRTIFDARASETLPGVRFRGEGDPKSKDPAVND